jgi:hypothetical protein
MHFADRVTRGITPPKCGRSIETMKPTESSPVDEG